MKTKLIIIFLTLSFQILLSQKKFNDIQIQTLNDIEISLLSVLEQKKDKPLILFTWSYKWCYPCVETLNDFQKFYYQGLRKNNDYDLKLIALNLDDDMGTNEIKKIVIDNEWYFDVYKDPKGNYQKKLNINDAPQIYLIVNGKIVNTKKGFVSYGEGSSNWANGTSNYMYYMVRSIASKKVYFDKEWNYTNSENALFVRYIDNVDDLYEVHDRWITGEIQMKGTYKDKFLTERFGEFTWYHKNGKKEVQSYYSSGLLDGIRKEWYENGQLWVEEEFNDDKLMNILELNSKNGNKLNKGNFSQGNGYIFRYDEDGNKKSREEYKNGKLDGVYTVYNSDGKVESKHLFKEGNYIKKLE